MSGEDHPSPALPAPHGALYRLVGKYLPDLIYGANDGIITTLAVVSGVTGAALSSTVILILGFANLVADGFSMGASNVLSRRSDVQNGRIPTLAAAAGHGIATFLGFVLAGLVPLLAYLLPWFDGARFAAATALALATLFAVGAGPRPLHRTRLARVGAGDAARGRPGNGCGLRRRRARGRAHRLMDGAAPPVDGRGTPNPFPIDPIWMAPARR